MTRLSKIIPLTLCSFLDKQAFHRHRSTLWPSVLRFCCSGLTFHTLRCVLFPSGHLRPSGVLDYPCGLQFSSPSLRSVGPQKSGGREHREYSSSYVFSPNMRPPGIVFLLLHPLYTCADHPNGTRPGDTTTSSCSPTIWSSSATRSSRSSSSYSGNSHTSVHSFANTFTRNRNDREAKQQLHTCRISVSENAKFQALFLYLSIYLYLSISVTPTNSFEHASPFPSNRCRRPRRVTLTYTGRKNIDTSGLLSLPSSNRDYHTGL